MFFFLGIRVVFLILSLQANVADGLVADGLVAVGLVAEGLIFCHDNIPKLDETSMTTTTSL
jgi:hypothetical protein